MDVLEDMALLAEEDECGVVRQRMAKRYRGLIGVRPEAREDFRSGLERIKAGGGMSPEDLAELIERDHQVNGSVLGRDRLSGS